MMIQPFTHKPLNKVKRVGGGNMDANTKKIVITVGIVATVVLLDKYFKISDKAIAMVGGQ